MAHKNLSCSSCHTSWASKCISCHNTFDKNKVGFDLLDRKEVSGTWTEMLAEFNVSLPALGVKEYKNKKSIECAVPGMIMTIDHKSFDSTAVIHESFYRLFAPNKPHTITKNVRSCKSCHLNSYTLGYGSGKLLFENNNWSFTAKLEKNINDNLPEDAWIEMFTKLDKNKDYSTKENFRPFNINEQKKILEVGKCLQCHKENSDIMLRSLDIGIIEISKEKTKNCL